MATKSPRWSDAAAFQWNPDVPLRSEPAAAGFAPANEDAPAEPRFSRAGAAAPRVAHAVPASQAAANSNRPLRYGRIRVELALLQGLLLFALFQNRAAGLYFAAHPDGFAATSMALSFAPLLLMQGLALAPGRILLPWTGLAALLLAGLGFYQSGRGPHPDIMPFALTALLLFTGQALVITATGADYAARHAIAWTLAVQVFLGALFAGLVWTGLGAGEALLRARHIELMTERLPLAMLTAALIIALTPRALLRLLKDGLLLALVTLLPLVIVIALFMSVGGLLGNGPGLAPALAFALLLLLCINASCRGGSRPRLQRACEGAGAFLLLLLTGFGVAALAARVNQHGWTSPRFSAAAALLPLGCWALVYGAAMILSLYGRGMRHFERGNLAVALLLLALAAAMLSPFGDPVTLAVASQTARVESGAVPPERFDFDYLRQTKPGQAALLRLAATHNNPALARSAFMALAAEPESPLPTPTGIGANIALRSGGVLPAALLARDWTHVLGAPPCLTSTAFACDAYFMDLDGDGRREILLVYGGDAHWWASVMKQGVGGGWYPAGALAPPCPGGMAVMRAGNYGAAPPLSRWRDLLVGGARLPVAPTARAPAPCPAQ